MREEGAQLLGGPHLLLGRCAVGWVDVVGSVVGHVAPARRVLERPVQERVDVADGLRCQALAVAPAAGEQLAVEGGDAWRGEPLQLQGTEGGDDVDLQVGLVVRSGRAAQPSLDRREPLLEQERLDGQLRRLDEGALVEACELGAERLLGGLLGGEAVLAVEAPLAGGRIGGGEEPSPALAVSTGATPHDSPSFRLSGAAGTNQRSPSLNASICPASMRR